MPDRSPTMEIISRFFYSPTNVLCKPDSCTMKQGGFFFFFFFWGGGGGERDVALW